MLHDPSHYELPPTTEEIQLSDGDVTILRELAAQVAEIADDPIHSDKEELWTNLNDLNASRPMVWINEICWHEMNVNDELTLRTEHTWAQEQERELRQLIYQWRHLPADMIVNDFWTCPLAIHSTDFGIIEDVDLAITDERSDIVSRQFHRQINDFDDLEKIKMPVVTHNEEATRVRYEAMQRVFNGILPVKKMGQTHIWFTPWDYLIRWLEVDQAMLDLVMKPDLIHAAVDRLVDAWMTELDQFEEQNLLALDCNNTRIGSGGYGYASDLPGENYDADYVRPHNMWGCSNAQIFSSVSPQMHWDFAIEHDLRWLERWGLLYYGCCEPLDTKMEQLRKISNLRKISVSPWCNTQKVTREIGADYVMSRKPSPAIFATETWHPELARKELVEFMDEAKEVGAHVELIMKDISTVSNDPQRLWDWSQIAMEVAQEYAS